MVYVLQIFSYQATTVNGCVTKMKLHRSLHTVYQRIKMTPTKVENSKKVWTAPSSEHYLTPYWKVS